MADRRLVIDINQTQNTPNATQDQGGFRGQAQEDKGSQETNNGLPIKRTAAAFGAGKYAYNTIQLSAYYSGNKVLQNTINRNIEAGKSMLQIGALTLVNPLLGGAALVNEFLDTAYANQQRTEEIRRTNLDAAEQRDLYNTNLNNNRNSGGQR